MSRYLKLSILLSLIFSIFSSPGMSQDFLTPSKDNDLDRQSKFIDAQSELIIGNTEGAIKIYDELLKKDVNDHEAAFFLGKTYFQEDDLANAIKYFSLALANEKENPWYYLWAPDAYQGAPAPSAAPSMATARPTSWRAPRNRRIRW